MIEKQIYNLQIDEYFKQLIPPLSLNEKKQLEENVVKDGCREPLCIWRNTIIDGHNRYEICTRLKIPFHIQQVEFNNKEEVIAWICTNQLGRRNISDETKRYLIGKRYETEKKLGAKNPSGKNQYSKKKNKIIINNEYQRKTAEELGNEYHISERTVRQYGQYSRTIDELAKKEPEFISEILKGKVKVSYNNILKLSELPSKSVNDVKTELINNDKFINYSNARKIIPVKKEKISVKNMPVYDPDAEISSLTLTIPSWVSSIDRTLNMANFDKTSANARKKLQKELKNLEYALNVMLLAVEEK